MPQTPSPSLSSPRHDILHREDFFLQRRAEIQTARAAGDLEGIGEGTYGMTHQIVVSLDDVRRRRQSGFSPIADLTSRYLRDSANQPDQADNLIALRRFLTFDASADGGQRIAADLARFALADRAAEFLGFYQEVTTSRIQRSLNEKVPELLLATLDESGESLIRAIAEHSPEMWRDEPVHFAALFQVAIARLQAEITAEIAGNQ